MHHAVHIDCLWEPRKHGLGLAPANGPVPNDQLTSSRRNGVAKPSRPHLGNQTPSPSPTINNNHDDIDSFSSFPGSGCGTPTPLFSYSPLVLVLCAALLSHRIASPCRRRVPAQQPLPPFHTGRPSCCRSRSPRPLLAHLHGCPPKSPKTPAAPLHPTVNTTPERAFRVHDRSHHLRASLQFPSTCPWPRRRLYSILYVEPLSVLLPGQRPAFSSPGL